MFLDELFASFCVMQARAKNGEFWYLSAVNAFFDDQRHFQHTRQAQLCNAHSWLAPCHMRRGRAFSTRLLCVAGSCAASGTRQRMGMTPVARPAASPASRSCGGSWRGRACTFAMSAWRAARWMPDQWSTIWNTIGCALEFAAVCTDIAHDVMLAMLLACRSSFQSRWCTPQQTSRCTRAAGTLQVCKTPVGSTYCPARH